ncbi:MAG: ATP-binding protein [Thiohalomonadales bacterium]
MNTVKYQQPNLDWFKIVLIDDSVERRAILETMLRDSGYQQVISFNNPIDALSNFHLHQPNLVLLELRLPRMNGLDVLRKLQDTSELENTDVIILSEDASQECKLIAFQYGAVDFISRPFNIELIQQRIDQLIESRFQVKRLVRKNKTLDLIVQTRNNSLHRQHKHLQRINENFERREELQNSALNNVHYKLKQSNVALDKLISIVSHEFRTPLTSIKGFAEILREDFDAIDAEDRARFFKNIETETSRMTGLITDLLELQKLNVCDGDWYPSTIDMSQLVKDTINEVQSAYDAKNIKLHCEFTSAPTSILGDKNKLNQLIFNTLSNALNYTDQGEVEVVVDITKHWAELILFSNNKETIDNYEQVAEELEITLHTFHDLDQLQQHLYLFGRRTSALILDINTDTSIHIHQIEKMCFPIPRLSIATITADDNFDPPSHNIYAKWLQAPIDVNAISLTHLIHDVTNVSINHSMVRVQISDTGSGIPNNQLNDIFSQFHQINHPDAIDNSGMGLGLTINQEIVERHNGKIWVESEWGNGSKFTVLIPMENRNS